MNGGWLAEISPGCWLAPWTGDPGRTVVEANATRYKTQGAANRALARARRKYAFRRIKGRAVRVETDRSETLVIEGNPHQPTPPDAAEGDRS